MSEAASHSNSANMLVMLGTLMFLIALRAPMAKLNAREQGKVDGDQADQRRHYSCIHT